MKEQTSRPSRKLVVPSALNPVVSCLAASTLTLLLVSFALSLGPFTAQSHAGWLRTSLVILIPACLTALLMLTWRKRLLSIQTSLEVLLIAVFVVVVGNTAGGLVSFIHYGDAGYLSGLIERNDIFPRWFLGSAILTRTYQSLWPTLNPLLPSTLGGADSFVRVAGAALMTCGSLLLLRRYGASLRLLIPLLSPVWILFLTGYNEYYPFIACGYVYFLFVVSERLDKYSPRFIAFVSSAMCVSYAAFAPLGLLLIVFYGFSTDVKRALRALLLMGLICGCLVVLLWPGSATSFAGRYIHTLNLGEQNTEYGPYLDKSAGSSTPFFSLSYAFSLEHLSHLSFMVLFGAGPVLLGLLVFFAYFWARGKRSLSDSKREGDYQLGVVLALQLLYSFFMIPKLGPIRDIDLFFAVYLSAGFVAGVLGDRMVGTRPAAEAERTIESVIGASLGSSAVLLHQMLLVGFS